MGICFGGRSTRQCIGTAFIFGICEQYALQVKHGDLVQFADACIICCGGSQEEVSNILSEDLCSLSSWIRNDHIELNVQKSNVM